MVGDVTPNSCVPHVFVEVGLDELEGFVSFLLSHNECQWGGHPTITMLRGLFGSQNVHVPCG